MGLDYSTLVEGCDVRFCFFWGVGVSKPEEKNKEYVLWSTVLLGL